MLVVISRARHYVLLGKTFLMEKYYFNNVFSYEVVRYCRIAGIRMWLNMLNSGSCFTCLILQLCRYHLATESPTVILLEYVKHADI